jgi:4-hydroxybenzoate polyprenyltransferase
MGTLPGYPEPVLMKHIRAFLELIKFEHTVFALPFAYLGMLLAAGGFPPWGQIAWITLAMAAARTLAMGFNRIADRWLDARNPRTWNRPLVKGTISLKTAWTGILLAGGVLTLSAWQLGPLPFRLLPGAILFLFGYSFTKRFTWLSHFFLGFTDGLAPMGAWAAVRGSLFNATDLPAWMLLGIVTLWIGGFDIIYACQDLEFDRQEHLMAIPAIFGVTFALRFSAFCHALTTILLFGLGYVLKLGWPFWVGSIIAGCLLAWEHALVSPDDLSRIDVAFFNINSYISLTLLVSILGALYLT